MAVSYYHAVTPKRCICLLYRLHQLLCRVYVNLVRVCVEYAIVCHGIIPRFLIFIWGYHLHEQPPRDGHVEVENLDQFSTSPPLVGVPLEDSFMIAASNW